MAPNGRGRPVVPRLLGAVSLLPRLVLQVVWRQYVRESRTSPQVQFTQLAEGVGLRCLHLQTGDPATAVQTRAM